MTGFGGPPAVAKLRSTCPPVCIRPVESTSASSHSATSIMCVRSQFLTPRALVHKISQVIVSMLFDFLDTEHDQRKNTDRERRHYQHGLSRGHPNAKQVQP